jgi:hypothetical protein
LDVLCSKEDKERRNVLKVCRVGMKKALPKKSSFSFTGWSPTAALTANPGQESADDVRQVDQICKLASHRHYVAADPAEEISQAWKTSR